MKNMKLNSSSNRSFKIKYRKKFLNKNCYYKNKYRSKRNRPNHIHNVNLTKPNDRNHKTKNYKLPILTNIELINDSQPTESASASTISAIDSNVLFSDYLLISSKTKFKYLLYTLFEQVALLNKQNYIILGGFLKLKDWEPICLNTICPIAQCFYKAESDESSTDFNINSLTNDSDSSRSPSSSVDTSENTDKSSCSDTYINSDQNDLVTVYDLLEHVVSFISIKIIVKLRNVLSDSNTDQPMDKTMESQKSRSFNQNNLMQSFLIGNEKSNKSPKPVQTKCSSHSLPSTSMSQVFPENHRETLLEEEEEIDQDHDDEDTSSDHNQASNTIQNSNLSSNLTSFFYSNPQLANALLFNSPMFSHLLNGFRNSETNNIFDKYKNLASSTYNPITGLSIETSQNGNQQNYYTSPSSSFSSASSTSSASSLKPPSNSQFHPSEDLNYNSKLNLPLNLALNKARHSSIQVQIKPNNVVKEKKQRERTTFDPHEEITRLMQIFEKTHHPTRYQISNICDLLNSLSCRKDKKPLEPYNIQYWFKNARASLRRKSKGNFSTENKNSAINDLGSNEESLDELDDFNENNSVNPTIDNDCEYYQKNQLNERNQDGLKQDESKINCDYQDDELTDDAFDNQSNSIRKNVSTNSLNQNGSIRSGNRRNRVFIDPISEVPVLEHYFSLETYPDHFLIDKICDALNTGEYRCKFPKLEARNIQLWFKNHRAKLKRLKSTPSQASLSHGMASNNQLIQSNAENSSKFYIEKEEDLDECDYGDYEEEAFNEQEAY